jgi:hypothetical protein
LRKGFQESFLRGFFGLTAIAKKTVSNMKDARAEAANDFGECRLIFFAREAGQFNFRRLFVVGRQKRASNGLADRWGSIHQLFGA